MTKEEIKNLKVGDKFTIEYEVGDMSSTALSVKLKKGGLHCTFKKKGREIVFASIIKPAPTFEEGDTVRIIPDPLSGRIHGTHYSQQLIGREGVIESIPANDDENTIWIRMAGYTCKWGISPHCLELVKKAVKDKFDVRRYLDFDGLEDGWGVCNKGTLDTIVYFANSYPNAEAAAKEECDRLNAEWKKQQEGNF